MPCLSLPRELLHSVAGQGLWCRREVTEKTATWMNLLFPNTANTSCPGKLLC